MKKCARKKKKKGERKRKKIDRQMIYIIKKRNLHITLVFFNYLSIYSFILLFFMYLRSYRRASLKEWFSHVRVAEGPISPVLWPKHKTGMRYTQRRSTKGDEVLRKGGRHQLRRGRRGGEEEAEKCL